MTERDRPGGGEGVGGQESVDRGDALGGLLLRVDGVLRFVPATVALRVAPEPRVTPLPGAPPELLGIALHEGAVVPVLSIGAARGSMVVCQHAGERIGLLGGEVVRAGCFARAADGDPGHAGQPGDALHAHGTQDPVAREHAALDVEHEGQRVAALDVAALYARVEAAGRPARWG